MGVSAWKSQGDEVGSCEDMIANDITTFTYDISSTGSGQPELAYT